MRSSSKLSAAAACLCSAAFLFGALGHPTNITGATNAGSIPVASGGHSQASIVLGESAGDLSKYAASELQKYLRILTGAEPAIIAPREIGSRPAKETLILLGTPATNTAVHDAEQARWVNFTGLKPEGFILKAGNFNRHPAIVAGGNDDASVMYAAYDLVEQMGVTFQLTGDFIPAPRLDLALPALDVRKEPAFPRRGFLLQDGGYENLTMFSYQDYVKLIDQMAKMKCNYMQFWWFSFEPWIRYSYKGEEMGMGDVSTKESGYLTWAHGGFGSRTTDDVSIGKQWFKGRRIAPPEMQNVETPGQAFDVAQDLLQKIIHHARERGIKVWPAVEMASLPPNLARYCERVGSLPYHGIFGTFVHPLDPVNREIQVNRLKALVETYPEAEGFMLVFAELYPELDIPKYHDYLAGQRPQYHRILELRWPWIDWGGGGNADKLLDSNIGFIDLFKFTMAKRDEIAPRVKLGMMGIGRGYTLPVLDKVLPKDVPFTDMESSGVWTPAGVPMSYFGGMGERERTIEPRVDDDVNMMGMQFNVHQYAEKDRIFVDGVKFGLSGFAGQLNRARGTESNTRFLAEAAWAPQMTTVEFYKGYANRLFGERAGKDMYDAYMALEENEAWLGYYNYGASTMNCCGSLHEVGTAYNYWKQENPFDGPKGAYWDSFINASPDVMNRFEGSVKLLNKALESMRAAQPNVAVQGKYELAYMINRTESYRDYIQSLITIRKAYIDFDRAFKTRSQAPYEQFVANLDKSLGEFDLACEQVQAATKHYAEVMDHPSDLGVLYHLNARAVEGFDLTRRMMRNVVNFHKGKDYTTEVPFNKLIVP